MILVILMCQLYCNKCSHYFISVILHHNHDRLFYHYVNLFGCSWDVTTCARNDSAIVQSTLISLCESRRRSSTMPCIHHCACEIWMGMPHIKSSIVFLYWLCPYRHANRLNEFIQQLNQCWHIVSRMMGNASQCMIFRLKYHQYAVLK